jgi:hypothetical protein
LFLLPYHGNAVLWAFACVSKHAMIVRFALSRHPANGAPGGADRRTASDTASRSFGRLDLSHRLHPFRFDYHIDKKQKRCQTLEVEHKSL